MRGGLTTEREQLMNDFLEYYSRHLEAVTKANALNKPIVFDALAAAGLTRVEVEFDGEGDSGQIGELTAYPADLQHPQVPPPDKKARSRHLCLECCAVGQHCFHVARGTSTHIAIKSCI
jgi:hypothetical protein